MKKQRAQPEKRNRTKSECGETHYLHELTLPDWDLTIELQALVVPVMKES